MQSTASFHLDCRTHLLHLLLDEAVLLGAGQLFRRNALLQLDALRLGEAQLALGGTHLTLVAVVRLHGGVQLVQHAQNLVVQLLAHLAAAPVDALHVLGDARQPRHQLRRVHVGQAGVVAAQRAGALQRGSGRAAKQVKQWSK